MTETYSDKASRHLALYAVPKSQAVKTAIRREPKRDWEIGFITGHRVRVVFYLLGTIAALYLFQAWMWPHSQYATTRFGQVWSWLSFLWVTAVIPGTVGLLGELAFRHPTTLDEVHPISRLVCWRIVSKGENVEVLTSTVRRIQKEMAKTPLFPYIIEVVTDSVPFVLPRPNQDVVFMSVPVNWETPNKSRFKARGLQYALLHSKIPPEAWIVHLDEETQPTSSGIKGICKMIHEEEISHRLRIGQGAILYHREWKKYPFLTLADNVRTGDDFARFHFQHQIGITFFGLHGSFIVVRNDIERKIGGFDFGPQGDITEDAFWAMVAMEKGYRCRWVEGYLEEQSCMSLLDFIKQRRRWFIGLAKVALFAPVRLRWRLCIGFNNILWALAPFSMLYTIAHFFYGFAVNPYIQFFANYSYASFVVLYFMGLKANLDEGIKDRKQLLWIRPLAYLVQAILTFFPVFSLLESAGVLFALIRPSTGFHVVKK